MGKMDIKNNIPPIETLKAELCKRDFYEFFKEFWDVIVAEELENNWHLKFLCDKLQTYGEKIINGEELTEEDTLIINISPATTKSTITSVMFPVWLWVKKPSLKIITGSHASSLAMEMSVKSRDILRSEKFKQLYPHIALKDDSDTKSQYSNTYGGSRVATSSGSSVIGQHAHIIIIDDPVSTSPSKAELKKANKWMTQELPTRKIDKKKTPIVLIMQRLADDDPTGHILDKKGDKVDHICLPAEMTDDVKPESVRDKYVNGLMDVNRLSKSVLADMKSSLGSYGYSSQFLQTPNPTEGGIIKKDWVKVQPLTVLDQELMSVPPQFFVDTAYTEDMGNDPSAMVVAKELNNMIYIIHAEQFWMEFPQLCKKIINMVHQWGYNNRSKIKVEPKASGKSLVQQLRNDTKLNIMEDDSPKISKDERLERVSPIIESGRVIFIDGRWNEELISQICSVKPTHDDLRDSLVMSINNLILNSNKGSGKYAYQLTR